MELHLDLETLPTCRPDVVAHLANNVKPPATYKKAESIAAWHKDEGPAATEEAVRKTSLDGTFGRICVIGWAIDDGEAKYLANDQDEGALLKEFHAVLQRELRRADDYVVRIVGHNVASFDLRFFMQRSMVHGIQPHVAMARASRAKPWENQVVFDTMIQWAGVGGRVKLDTLCKALGIDSPKGELDGSKVWDWVQAGRIKEVGEYCIKDVEATRAVFKRMVYQT